MLRVKSGRWAVLVAAVALGGCAGDSTDEEAAPGKTAPNIVQPGAPGEPTRTLSAEELSALEPSVYTDADVGFMQGMVHHHAQALRMTMLVPQRSTRSAIELLARRIDASQEAEIAQIREWLRDRDQEVPVLHRGHGHAHGAGVAPMPGMLTEAELRRLERARGASFDRLFLRSMIQHHRGALTMVARLYASNGGVEPAADAFARHVDSDQTIEIARMQQLLAELGSRR